MIPAVRQVQTPVPPGQHSCPALSYGGGMACRISELVIDARDSDRLAAFWCEVLGFVELERIDGSSPTGALIRAS
jgi:hypothetical protein